MSKIEQLERIREIWMSERKFYQKVTDLYATAIEMFTITSCRSLTLQALFERYKGLAG